MNDAAAQRRRLSVSTIGIHGASPTSSSAPYHFRRASTSTNSESIDECAIEEDDMGSPTSAKTAPTTPFRRMSVSGAAPRGFRNGSIGTADQGQFAWSEQLRSRAESSISGNRASFSLAPGFGTSPPRGGAMPAREPPRPTTEMPAPPAQYPAAAKPRQPERRKPDAFQERILKGDFYMD